MDLFIRAARIFFTLSKRRGDRPRSTRRDDRISLRHFRCTFGAFFAAVRPPIIRLVRLRSPTLSNPADHRYRGLDCTAFGAWTHSARNATGGITHPLQGNSVFSEREALLKCTERFGPALVSPVMANFFGLADLR